MAVNRESDGNIAGLRTQVTVLALVLLPLSLGWIYVMGLLGVAVSVVVPGYLIGAHVAFSREARAALGARRRLMAALIAVGVMCSIVVLPLAAGNLVPGLVGAFGSVGCSLALVALSVDILRRQKPPRRPRVAARAMTGADRAIFFAGAFLPAWASR